MIKREKYKLWQMLAQWSDKFWRSFGNMYTQKLIWYCDDCGNKIPEYETKWEDYNKQYCQECYEIKKM